MTRRTLSRTASAIAALMVVSLVAAGCGGGSDFTQEEASALILAQFPEADLQMRSVSIDEEGRGVAFALLNEEMWSFYFAPGEDGWVLDAVETDGNFFYLRDLEQIAATTERMSEFASALERYRASNGSYPVGGDAEALQALVPDFVAPDTAFTDAWDGALVYESDGDDYTMISYGADKSAGGRDDVILYNGQFVGPEEGRGQ